MHSIDFSQVRCHVEFNAHETEAVMNRPTGLTYAVLTVLDHVVFATHRTVLWNFCLLKALFIN